MKKDLRSGLPLLLGSLIVSLILYMYLAQHLPLVRSLLERNLTDKVQAIAGLSKPAVAKAIETGDDISLIIQMESLSRTDDVAAAYVLDEKGAVVIHNRNSEWHKTYTDAVSKKAVSSSSAIVQRVPHGYLYSVPVASSATLCVLLSSQKSDDLYTYTVRRAFLTGGILILLSLAFILFLVSAGVIAPLRRIGNFVRNFVPGNGARLPTEGSAEMTALAAAVNEMAGRCEQEHRLVEEHADDVRKNAAALLDAMLCVGHGACIVTDAENTILSVNDAAKKIWGASVIVGKHILDVKELAELVVLVQSVSAYENLGREITRIIRGRTVAAIAVVNDGKKIAGKIIKVVD